MSSFSTSSMFRSIANRPQIRFNEASKRHVELFNNVVYKRYLDIAPPTIGTSFEDLIGQYNVNVVAPVLGPRSEEPILGIDGLNTFKEKALHYAITRMLTEQEFRDMYTMLNATTIGDEDKRKRLTDLLWGNVMSCVGGVEGRVDTIFLQALSHCGKCTFDETTNPGSGLDYTIDFKQPEDNILLSNTQWTYTNSSTVDCYDDIQKVIDKASSKTTFAKILISPVLLSYFLRATSTRKMMYGTDKSARIPQLSELNTYLESNGLPVFEVIRRNVRLLGTNGKMTTYNPFSEDNLVFVPEGKLGVVRNAYTRDELIPDSEINVSKYGFITVSQWVEGTRLKTNSAEYIKAEALALPVITEFDGIYTLCTRNYDNV